MIKKLRSKNKILLGGILAVALVAAALVWHSPQAPTEKQLLGMIVPHHDLVLPLIDEMFQKASREIKPTTIIVLGPNHKDVGKGLSVSTVSDFSTSIGEVRNATEVTSQLINTNFAVEDFSTLREEHSVTTLLPLVHQYFSDAKIVPIILQSDFTPQAIESLSLELSKILQQENTFLIASIDFSHYLPSDVAPQKDATTIELIAKRDYANLLRLNSDYFDSGPTLITVLQTLEQLGTIEDQLVHNTNSGLYVGERIESSTSYLLYFFWK